MQDRKEILRLVIKQITLWGAANDERMDVRIEWQGQHVTEGQLIRPVARLDQVSTYAEVCERVKAGVTQKRTALDVADELNAAGLRPPKRRTTWNSAQIRDLAQRLGLQFSQGRDGRAVRPRRPPRAGDWWTMDGLAHELKMPVVTLYTWLRRDIVKGEQVAHGQAWRLWADETEVQRLHVLRAEPVGARHHKRWVDKATSMMDELEVRDVSP